MALGTDEPLAFVSAIPDSTVDTKYWWRSKNLRALNLLLVFPMLSIFTQGFDGSMMNGLQSVENWRNYFGEPKGATLGLFNAAYPIGGLCAIPFISIISDTFGRRAGLACGASLCILGATLQAAAQSLPMFVVARGILGCGTVFLGSSGAPLITEIAHPAHRATATALFNTSYSLGAIVAAWTTFGTFRIESTASWRIPSGLQGLPSIIQLLGLYFVPESPRWLASKDRNEEALAFLAKYHAEGNEHDALVQFEYDEIRSALAYERTVDRGSWLQNYLELVRTPGNRKRMFILLWTSCIAQMSGNAFISYYLSPVLTSVGLTSSLEQTLINATQQVLSWISAMYFATLPEKLGRKMLFLGSLTAIFVCLVSITAGSAVFAKNGSNKAAGGAVVAFLYLFSPSYNLGLNGNLVLYITEILPYSLRMRGQACFQFFSTCFTLISTYAVPVGLESMAWKFYIIFIPWVVVEFAVLYFVYPETKGPSLEEIAIIFDGVSTSRTGSSGKDGILHVELEKSDPADQV
ncbi:lactose permease [Colletotrichum higginsianum]|uniref:Lactose permease n=1 Tax=Colletotrichum higginsianum (strain IMI 349063) TaxID=759273 RepID=H1V8E6_COLHI|nr:Lactose permease [Colletotrichum higginsianum IMI 349063]OBR14824.1 Lactose permease [Colletotrichum higginsianum IMI 349063]CCF36499.1 lactose permease [Colletotrichum higginsianum]